MKKITIPFLTAIGFARPPRQRREELVQWLRDPLSHPDLEAMSEREIADLPFERGSRPPFSEGCAR